MHDQTTVVRWRRHGRKTMTMYHLPIAVPADDRGATACGLRYERRRAEAGALADGELCRNCLRAVASVPEPAA